MPRLAALIFLVGVAVAALPRRRAADPIASIPDEADALLWRASREGDAEPSAFVLDATTVWFLNTRSPSRSLH